MAVSPCLRWPALLDCFFFSFGLFWFSPCRRLLNWRSALIEFLSVGQQKQDALNVPSYQTKRRIKPNMVQTETKRVRVKEKKLPENIPTSASLIGRPANRPPTL